jgi:cysteine desulfurase
MARSYLDHAASTPLVPAAIEAMTRELSRVGNASALHASGRAVRRVVEESRELIAERLGARPAEVIFTSGATEADNLAVKGAFWARAGQDRRRVVVSAVEHSAVLASAEWLASAAGADVVQAPVDGGGRVRLADLRAAVTPGTALVSVVWAANEVGVVQPVEDVAAIAREAGALSHSDAVQAVAQLPVDFAASGLDLLSVTAHKLGGPPGIGALVARRDAPLVPVLHGGGQERDVRSGTVVVAAISGFAAALDEAVGRRETEARRLAGLRAELVDVLRAADPHLVLYGPAEPAHQLPGILTVGFPGCSGDALLMLLDAAGIDVSTGSACSSGVTHASHVLLAMGVDDVAARSVLRFSLGHTTTAADLEAVAAVLPDAVRRARTAGVLTG